jgi:hypothetical protein
VPARAPWRTTRLACGRLDPTTVLSSMIASWKSDD